MRALCYITGDNIVGNIELNQDNPLTNLYIFGIIKGLSPGKHGFHIHEYGMIYGCADVGNHLNPFNKKHGAPEDCERHLGDLGNIIADNNGVARINKYDSLLSLFGDYSILGRSIVIHSNEDDLGKGNNSESKRTGNSGHKLACGTIIVCP